MRTSACVINATSTPRDAANAGTAAPAINSLRVIAIATPPRRRPVFPIRPLHQRIRVRVSDHALRIWIEPDRAPRERNDVPQMRERARQMPLFNLHPRLFPAPDAIQKIPRVRRIDRLSRVLLHVDNACCAHRTPGSPSCARGTVRTAPLGDRRTP